MTVGIKHLPCSMHVINTLAFSISCRCCDGVGSSNPKGAFTPCAARGEIVRGGKRDCEGGGYAFWQLTTGSSRVSGICHQRYQYCSMLHASDNAWDRLWCTGQGVLGQITHRLASHHAWCKRPFIPGTSVNLSYTVSAITFEGRARLETRSATAVVLTYFGWTNLVSAPADLEIWYYVYAIPLNEVEGYAGFLSCIFLFCIYVSILFIYP